MATWTNIIKGGLLSELWSSSYLPWDVGEQPWLNDDVTGGTDWTNLIKN